MDETTQMSDAPLMLSVSGMRGLIGRSMTPAIAARFAASFGHGLRQESDDAPLVLIGRDSRPSGPMIEHAAVAGLLSVGCRVVQLGIVATPSVAVMIDQLDADGALVATASHNPIEWNGLKPLTRAGVAPPPDQARRIIDRFHQDAAEMAPVEALQPVEADATAHQVHVGRVVDQIDADAIDARRPKVVLDSVHGAGGPAAAMLLETLGVELVHLYAEPTGQFPHTPEPTRENLTGLCDAVREHGADIGFAQDPDADRLAVVDETGRYIGEEYTLALAALHVLSRTPGLVAANLSTSRMIDDLADRFGGSVVRTPVGEANVAAAMREHQAVIGGEGNGGVIWPAVACVRDSLGGMALLLELLARRDRPLSEIVADIPAYAIVKTKQPIAPGGADGILQRLTDRYASEKIDTQDGVRLDRGRAWVHVRPSNTEPILRVIAEAPDEPAAHALIDEMRQEIDAGG